MRTASLRNASLAPLLAGAVLLAGTYSAHAQSAFLETDLVSDIAGRAAFTDPHLVNPWGLVPGGPGTFWVADNGTGVSTLYQPDGTIVNLVVSIPGGVPTGIAHVNAADPAFLIPSADTTARAIFIFVGEDGSISAWNPNVNPNAAIEVGGTPGAIYKGVALANTSLGPVLYAANFRAGTVDMFDRNFHPLSLSGQFFDPDLPAGYAPFNIANINGEIFVSYAKQDTSGEDDVPGPGFGYINVFDIFGNLHRRFASAGALNAPWGMALAPPGFGDVAGALLVGNFGDGRINAFDLQSGAFVAPLRNPNGAPIAIEGLWGLHFGPAVSDSVAHRLYFAAGIAGETHGLFGYLSLAAGPPPPPPPPVVCENHFRGVGFWRSQCARGDHPDDGDDDRDDRLSAPGLFDHRHDDGEPSDSLRALFACVTGSSRTFGPGGCFVANCALLGPRDGRDDHDWLSETDRGEIALSSRHHRRLDREQAARLLLVLLLNRCSGRICDSLALGCRDEDDGDDGNDDADHQREEPRTVGEAIAFLDSAICSGGPLPPGLPHIAGCLEGSANGDRDDGDDGDSATEQRLGRGRLFVSPLGRNPVPLGQVPAVRLQVSTTGAAVVQMKIYDAAGRMVAEPLRGVPVFNRLEVSWDGRDLRGAPVPQGTYFYRATSGIAVATGRIVIVR